MGLDMYMWKSREINVYDWAQKDDCTAKRIKVKYECEFADGSKRKKSFELENPQHCGDIMLPVAYWRKANAIHRWILEHTNQEKDDCQRIYVSGKRVLELIADCKAVLKDHSLAEKLLPTQDGFFFGGTEYDEWYYKDLERTIDMLKDTVDTDDFIYQASW